jgi:hypothetical protein
LIWINSPERDRLLRIPPLTCETDHVLDIDVTIAADGPSVVIGLDPDPLERPVPFARHRFDRPYNAQPSNIQRHILEVAPWAFSSVFR